MPAQKVLWLPDFLRRSQSARAALGVQVPPRVAKEGMNPENYMAYWETKAEELLRKREKQEPGGVKADLELLGPPEVDLYDLDGESLRSALANHHNWKNGPGWLLEYLRRPSPALKQELLEMYPPDDELEPLSPQEEVEEQEKLEFVEFLEAL